MASTIERRPLLGSTSGLGSQLWRNQSDSLVRGHVALYGSASASSSLIEDALQCAREARTFLTFHQSPTVENAQLDERYFGRSPITYLADKGLLTDALLLTHMNALSSTEEITFRQSDASIAWCPANAINWGLASMSPVPRLMAHGKRVALGSDVPKTWALSDQITIASMQARSIGVDLDPERLFDGVFTEVPRLLGSGFSGRGVEPGCPADLVVRKPDLPEGHPEPNLMGYLSIAKAGSINKVVVNGSVVFDNGPTQVDAKEAAHKLASKAREVADSL
jgi:5-methylthioadenosine/S-adenosylhomocysteine deaminase